MCALLKRLAESGKEVGLKINIGKTVCMRSEATTDGAFRLEDKVIKEADNFKYLGTIMQKSGSLELEFKERFLKAHQTMGMLKNIWRSKRLTVRTKILLYVSLVRSVFIYGHESWYDNETLSRKLLVFENKALRRILGIRWQDRISNQSVRDKTDVPWLDTLLMESRWKWLGHVLRRDKKAIVRNVVQWTPTVGRRRRGRPKPTWIRTMKREAGADWDSVEEDAQDRGGWRERWRALCVNRRWRR